MWTYNENNVYHGFLQLVKVTLDTGLKRPTVTLEWGASPMSDMVADAVIALAMEAQSSPVTLKMTSTPCCAHRKTKLILKDAKEVLDQQLEQQRLEEEEKGAQEGMAAKHLELLMNVEQGGDD